MRDRGSPVVSLDTCVCGELFLLVEGNLVGLQESALDQPLQVHNRSEAFSLSALFLRVSVWFN